MAGKAACWVERALGRLPGSWLATAPTATAMAASTPSPTAIPPPSLPSNYVWPPCPEPHGPVLSPVPRSEQRQIGAKRAREAGQRSACSPAGRMDAACSSGSRPSSLLHTPGSPLLKVHREIYTPSVLFRTAGTTV